jgi:hypothetical protein
LVEGKVPFDIDPDIKCEEVYNFPEN